MLKNTFALMCVVACLLVLLAACNQPAATPATADAAQQFGGFDSQIKWGAHLVTIAGCNDCHTPKKMGPRGPENDSSLTLSGSPANLPLPAVDIKALQAKGVVATNFETAWIGPWGITYSANITSDSTGIGNWTEQQFIKALREGKWMGLDNTRPIMPPMPVEDLSKMTDDELKAVFAYLKSTKPVHNVQPAAQLLPPPPPPAK